MQGQESQPSWLLGRFDRRTVLLGAVVIALIVVALLGMQRELRSAPGTAANALPMTERGVDHAPLSAADESYAAALWAIHAQVKQDAVRMTFAGLSYQMKDIKAADLRERVQPLTANFQAAQQRIAGLQPSSTVKDAHDRYLSAVKRYEDASKLMTQFAADSNNEHLVKAQEISQLASEDLLRVSDVLWPGEHKPN